MCIIVSCKIENFLLEPNTHFRSDITTNKTAYTNNTESIHIHTHTYKHGRTLLHSRFEHITNRQHITEGVIGIKIFLLVLVIKLLSQSIILYIHSFVRLAEWASMVVTYRPWWQMVVVLSHVWCFVGTHYSKRMSKRMRNYRFMLFTRKTARAEPQHTHTPFRWW